MEDTAYDTGAPTIQVLVYRDEELIARELCESDEEAMAIIDAWSEEGSYSFRVDDLSVHHRTGDILEPEPALLDDEAEWEPGAVPIAAASVPEHGVE
jgi:hypothetical protein